MSTHESARPLLSVVVPCLNVESWIDETLRSILTQSFHDLEVIVVDDGSTDGTLGLLEWWTHQDSRVVVTHSDGVGGGTARNVGIDLARGRYLTFSDADDIVPRGAYLRMVTQLERSGSDMGAGRYLKFSPSRTWDPTQNWPVYKTAQERTDLRSTPALIRGRACWNKMFRLDFWRAESLRFPDVPRSNDIFPITAAMNRAMTIDVIPDVVYLYRERPGPLSMTAKAITLDGVRSYLEQELRCARELDLLTKPEVGRTYARLLLQADLWVHLLRLVASQDATLCTSQRGQEARELASLVSQLVDCVPDAQRPKLTPVQVAVYEVIQSGGLTQLEGLNESASVGRPEALGNIAEFPREWAVAQRLVLVHEGFREVARTVLRQRVLKPLEELIDRGELEKACAWSAVASNLSSPGQELWNVLAESERSLLMLDGDPARVRMTAEFRAVSAVSATFTGRRNVFRVRAPRVATGTSISFVARHRDSGEARLLGKQGAGVPSELRITGSDLQGPGVWLLEMRFKHGDVTVDLAVVSPEIHPSWPVRRWHRTIASPVLREGNQIVFIRRESLLYRLVRKVARLFRATVTRSHGSASLISRTAFGKNGVSE